MKNTEADILARFNTITGSVFALDRTLWIVPALGLGDMPCGALDDDDQRREDLRAMQRRRTLVAIADASERYMVLSLKNDGVTEEHWHLYHQPTEEGGRKAAYAGERMRAMWGAQPATDEDRTRVRTMVSETYIEGLDWHQLDPPWRWTTTPRAHAAAGAVAALSDWRVPVHVMRWIDLGEKRAKRRASFAVFVAAIGANEQARLEALNTANEAIAAGGCRIRLPHRSLAARAAQTMWDLSRSNTAPVRVAELVAAPQHAFCARWQRDDNASSTRPRPRPRRITGETP